MSGARQAVFDAAQNYQKIPHTHILFARASQFYSSGKLADAQAEYRKILKKRPNHFASWHMLGLCEYQSANYEAAARFLKRALVLDPQSAPAQSDLGVALAAIQRHDEAIACFDRAIALKPECFDAHYNRASVLNQLCRYAEAVTGFDRAIAINAQHTNVWKNRSTALRMLYRFDDALASCDQAIAIAPGDAGNWSNRAEILRLLGQHAEALKSCNKSLSIDPDLDVAWLFRARALRDLGRTSEAQQTYRRALAINPDLPEAMIELSVCLAIQADPETAITYVDQALSLDPANAVALSNRIFFLDFIADHDFAAHQQARSQWWNQVGAKIAAACPLQEDREFDPNKRIVLGYVSADFKHHSAAFTYRQVLQCHDRSQFEVICYSGGHIDDGVTASFRERADRWRDARLWSDDQLAQCIRDDRVDILIDLSGHTEGNRLGVFARKPAPIQVTAWGHATGTGLRTMDYLFSDPVMIPQEVRHLFAEQVHDLPCAITIEPPAVGYRSVPPVISNGYLTYGVFNRISKISDAAITLWGRILRADPTAQLMIKHVGIDVDSARDRLAKKFAAQGIAESRLQLVGATDREQHLAAYGSIDICLDPFPHGGGVSSWEALHMGVPIVSKIGNALPKRIAGAIMSAVGLADWIANDDDQYVDIALRSTPDRLGAIRRELPDLIAARCGPEAYTRAVEDGYRTMWKKRCGQSRG